MDGEGIETVSALTGLAMQVDALIWHANDLPMGAILALAGK